MLRKRKMNHMELDDGTRDNNFTTPRNYRYRTLLIYICIIVLSYYCILWISNIKPSIKLSRENENAFNGQHAISNLEAFIDKTGERLTGSSNLAMATQLIYEELVKLKSLDSYHEITLDKQKSKGAFFINFLESFVNTYSNVTNIIMQIGPHHMPSLLINCHYDSVIGASGASDDAINCFTMIQIIKILVSTKQPLKNSIIFLFNGAEEMILQGSHGFISNHRLARSVRAVINLDACGTPGRLLLFQSGGQGWMLKAYAKVAKYPYGGGALLTLYRTGLIPMQTDFYIFHKVAHIEASLDFAFVQNNYVYHTKYDLPRFIDGRGVQSAGEDLLALAKEIANGPDLGSLSPSQNSDSTTYTLDFLGLKFIAYPLWLDRLMTCVACALAWLYVYANVKSPLSPPSHSDDQPVDPYYRPWPRTNAQQQYKNLALACASLILGWVSCFGAALSVAWFLFLTGCVLSWFNHTFLIVGLYHASATVGLLAFHSGGTLNPLHKLPHADHLIYDASVLGASLFCAGLSYYRLELGNLFWFWLLCSVLGPLLMTVKSKCATPRTLNSTQTAIALLPTLVPTWIFIYVYFVMGTASIPIMGLMGHTLKPDYLLAALCSLQVIALFYYPVTFAYKEKVDTKRIASLLFGVSLLSLALATMTPLGFPFSSNPDSPVLSRQYVVHTNREFHRLSANNGPWIFDNIYSNDSGLWVMPLDTFGFQYLAKRHLEAKHDGSNAAGHQDIVVDCEKWVYCGMPYRLPVRSNIKKTLYIPAISVNVPPETVKISSTDVDDTTKSFSFTISDVKQLSVIICPQHGWNVTKFTMAPNSQPFPLKFQYQGRQTHFAIYVNGEEDLSILNPYTFTLELTKLVGRGLNIEAGMVDVTLTLHYMTGPYSSSDELVHFVKELPPWIYGVPYTARYLHYSI